MSFGGLYLLLKLRGFPEIVAVEKSEQAPVGMTDANVPSGRDAPIGLTNIGKPIAIGDDVVRCVVRGSIIHDDDLEIAIRLIQNTDDRGRNVGSLIVGRDDNADGRSPHQVQCKIVEPGWSMP